MSNKVIKTRSYQVRHDHHDDGQMIPSTMAGSDDELMITTLAMNTLMVMVTMAL